MQDEAEVDGLRLGNEEGMQEPRGDGDGAEPHPGEYDEDLDEEPEEVQPDLHRVWVLCGGSGSEADASLASGLHVYHELQKQADVLVSPTLSTQQSFAVISCSHSTYEMEAAEARISS